MYHPQHFLTDYLGPFLLILLESTVTACSEEQSQFHVIKIDIFINKEFFIIYDTDTQQDAFHKEKRILCCT
jgi:hypothetical protein